MLATGKNYGLDTRVSILLHHQHKMTFFGSFQNIIIIFNRESVGKSYTITF